MYTCRSNKHFLGALLFVAAVVAAGCTAAAKSDAYFGKIQPPEGQTLRYITGAEPQTLDPQFMTGVPESRIAVALFDGLVEYEEVSSLPRPSLATSWEVSPDGTVWTFHLRKDAKWTDGAPLNANDFVYSWRRALSAEFAAPYASMMHILRHGKAYNSQQAFVRDPQSGKFVTENDFERAQAGADISCTGAEPQRFDKGSGETGSKEKYLFVPADREERAKLLSGEAAKNKPAQPALSRFLEGKEFVPVTKEYVGVRALDDYTFQVTLETPTAYFIKMLYHNFFRPVPRQAIEKWGDQLWVKPGHIVTSGAFRLASWTPYEKIVVERNPLFWDNANTKLDRIIFPAIEQLTTAMNLYKSGEVDCTQSTEVPPAWRKQLKETKKDYKYGPFMYIEFLAVNTATKPLDDARVRRAISMAINRQILADQAPGRQPLTAFTPQMEGYESARGNDFNPEKARALLAEAGFPGGRGFPPIELLYNTAESNKQTMEFIQAMLKRELNIQVELTNVEWRVYLDRTRNSKREFKGMARRGWNADYVDPYTFLELMTTASENNGTGWGDKKYDTMLQASSAELDPAKRAKMMRDAESYMLEQQPIIPLFVGPTAFVCKPYVKNLVSNVLDQHDWRGVYIDHSVTAESLGISEASWRSKYFALFSRSFF
ncbi:MAG: peptide ABC transporter substrate-binding protein [Pyrinomonadaceae bacterium]|nr:peptide ABC transporter substrate-binding protein [Pyrinomonadaceae bacterium]